MLDCPMVRAQGYRQFCPVALAAELLAERWTLLVVRELLCGSTRFGELQKGLPRISPALLDERLKKLQFAGIVERHQDDGRPSYVLTTAGRELFPVIEAMGLWSQAWLRHDMAADRNLDPDLLMWDIRRTAAKDAPRMAGRHVVAFALSGVPARKRSYWLVFDSGAVDLCYRDPGEDADLRVAAPLRLLTRLWLGHVSLDEALRAGLHLDGPRAAVAAFPRWFVLSPFARADRAAIPVPAEE
ncbi:MAG TPA: helix-turn-helix domain-containing protein [Paracoccus sp. (in: a-proteobacteria)]|nr:helix-turn-helix domain-containing protein [Paracoccus sp. (in: a-proteobacteria)]